MRRILRRLWVPILVVVGLILIAPQGAEAARWRRYARRGVYVQRPYYVAPPVRVYTPRVGVYVGPGVHVYAPGVGVNVGPWYGSYYGGTSCYGW